VAAENGGIGSDRFYAGSVVTIAAGHSIHDTFSGFLAPLLPSLIARMALTKTEAGVLTLFLQWPSLFQPVLGHLADRVNVRLLIVLAPTVTAVTMSLLGVAPAYGILALLLALAGVSSAGLHAAGPPAIGNLSGRKLGLGMGLWMVGGELGRTLGPIAVVTALQLWDSRGMLWLMVAGPVTSVVLLLHLRSTPEAYSVPARPFSWWETIQRMSPLLISLSGIVVTRAFAVASLSTYLPTFLTEQGASLWLAGASLSVFEAAGVVGALLGGTLSDRLGRRLVLGGTLVVTPILIFLFLSTGGWAQIALLLLLGFCALSATPVLLAFMQETFPENRGLATGTFMALSFVSQSLVVVILGLLADWAGMHRAFYASGLLSLAGLPFVFLLPRKAMHT
jgi:FSR family fosmidomycin resistance protein-like MFS transporter